MNENVVTNASEKKAIFTVKRIMRVLSLLCIVCAFCPSFLVSCAGDEAKIDIMTAVQGVKLDDNEWIVEPHTFMLVCLLIPILVLVLLFIKKIREKQTAVIIAGCTVADFIIWLIFKAKAEKIAENLNCSFKVTGWYKVNLIALLLIILMSMLIVLNVVRLNTDLVALFSSGGVRNAFRQMSANTGQMPSINNNTAVICSGCGKEIPNECKFCMFCGTPRSSIPSLEEELEAVKPIEGEKGSARFAVEETINKRQNSKTVIAAIAVIAIGMLLGGVIYVRTQRVDAEISVAGNSAVNTQDPLKQQESKPADKIVDSDDKPNAAPNKKDDNLDAEAVWLDEEDARASLEQWFEENPLIYYDYEIELSEKYPSGPKYGGYWYDLYIGNLFYDMIYVDAETGELVMGEGDINTPMDKWYAETWLPYLDGDNGGVEEPAYGYEGDVAAPSGSYTDYQEWGGWYDDGWETELQLGLYSDGSQDPECGGMTTYFRGMENTGDLYYLGDNAFRWESEGYESSNPETYYVYAVYEGGEYQLVLYNSDGNYETTFTLYEQYIP